ncbi:MAG TPA: phenylalanine--tRNA ligase subunit beta [Gaiellaceae bacterium]|nr:phenylalanine--tRNA ligase subunit beta [Gaiellaceae bacterium]
MKVPVSWLREYVAFDLTLRELADRLAVSTSEVERISRRGVPDADGNLGRFLVGRVVEAGKHPNADRLQLCRVDVGEGEPRQIVCGAWNFGPGATVAVALPGALLPGAEQPLGEAKLRGELSRGMILSERELELGQDHAGILVLDEPYEPGTPLADVLPLAEDVLELEVTGNRPDLLSVYGLAREVAALLDTALAPMPGEDPPSVGGDDVSVTVEELEACPVYVGRLFRDVRVGPSPVWLRARLTAAGMRPISNVVDATNYAMVALGSPLHAFDHATLAGGRIVVRYARPGEQLTTLDGQERTLDPRDLVIADAERAIAVAAIMGGEETEVTDATTTVLLEAANFEPVGILRSSGRLRLRTDGSNRWEKGVDPYLAEAAARLCSQLIVETSGARWTGAADVRGHLPEQPVVRYRPERASALIGLDVDADEQESILRRLGFEVGAAGAAHEVRVPTWRARDVTREVDLVEEVARFELGRVPFTLPRRRAMFGALTPAQRLRRTVEDVLVGAGFSEAYTTSLVAAGDDDEALCLPEPPAPEQAALRTTLLPEVAAAVGTNEALGNEDPALFEVARVYLPRGDDLPEERWHVAAALRAETGERAFARAKGALETLLAALRLPARFRPAGPGAAEVDGGVVSELADGLAGFELDLDSLLERLPGVTHYEDVTTFPALKQDLAFAVDESVPAGDLVEAVREAAGPELRDVHVFDVYRGEQVGEGRKSLALRVTFASPERTLSDEDAARLRERIVAEAARRFGATLRA